MKIVDSGVYVHREIEARIKRYLARKEIIAILGPRQCGKTTLLKHIASKLKKCSFVDFTDRKKLSLFDNDIDSFIELYVKGYDFLFLDEFQYSKEGGKKLKYLYDNFQVKVFISGSSSTEISIQSIKYLVGRIFVLVLFPFSFSEFLSCKNKPLYEIYKKRENFSEEVIIEINKLYDEFAIYGGYPGVVLSHSKEEKKTVLKNIYNIYLLKEIKEILGIKEDYKLTKLMHALALQVGGLVNYHELGQISNFNYTELKSYINILNKTFVTYESKPFHTNKRTELSKNPKIFFIDNGFRNVIMDNFQEIENRSDKGQLNENFVSSEIVKHEKEAKYWRTKSKAEIDFILEDTGRIIPLEVKSDLREPKISKSMYSFGEKYKTKRVFVLSKSLDKEIKASFGKACFKPLFSISRILSRLY